MPEERDSGSFLSGPSLCVGSLRHRDRERDHVRQGDVAEGQERGAVAQVIDDLPGSESAELRPDADHGRDRALRKIVTPRAAHAVGDHQGRERSKDAGADAVEHLNADQPKTVVGDGVEDRADRQVAKPTRSRGFRPHIGWRSAPSPPARQ